MGKMAVDSKAFPAETTAYRRSFVWAQIIIAFLFLEFAIWAPTPEARNRWAAIAAITILVLVLIDRPSLARLGLGLPKMFGASVVLGIGLATVGFMVILVSWAGGQIPANTPGSNLRLAWGYAIWALLQEFMLQSFFFNRCEELYGSSAAVWMASTLFAAAHLPSPVLTTATLIGAFFFCEMFRRTQHLSPRDHPRDAGTDHCPHHARQPAAPHAGGDWVSAVLASVWHSWRAKAAPLG